MKKTVLLYATKFMCIYQDIVKCLKEMNFDVMWIEANTISNNPFNKTLGLYNQKNIADYMLKAERKWKTLLEDEKLKDSIDYFLSIDGMDIPSFVFEVFRELNPRIRMILYMYDRVEGVYQIDRFFKYYDEVFSFDLSDCSQFGLSLLPIYWVPVSSKDNELFYDIFAFASYSSFKKERTLMFSKLKRIAKKKKYREYIKLYDRSYADNKYLFAFKSIVKYVLKVDSLSLWDICNGLITGSSVKPDEYRELINSSNVIFDTQASYQDGLTARFMWALGAGKKIITTNTHVRQYDFYNENQVFILDNNMEDIDSFIGTSYNPDLRQQKKIESYRIDNWIRTLIKQ